MVNGIQSSSGTTNNIYIIMAVSTYRWRGDGRPRARTASSAGRRSFRNERRPRGNGDEMDIHSAKTKRTSSFPVSNEILGRSAVSPKTFHRQL